MKFTTAVSIFAAAGSAVAAPKPASYSKQAFRIMTLRTASPIHFGATQASKGNVYVNLRDQGATCDKPTTEAYYSLEYDSLYLYNESAQKQLVYVDRSITDQGQIRYLTEGEDAAPEWSELRGWEVHPNDELKFKGSDLIACQKEGEQGYTMWIAGVEAPEGNQCIGFTARVLSEQKPVSCTYSQ